MSALRLINETTASSVSSVSITDVFTTDYDIYKITTKQTGFSGNTSIDGRYINASGSIIFGSAYDLNRLLLKANTSFSQERTANNNDFRSFGEADDDGATSVSYIFDPMNSSTYTFFYNENTSSAGYNMKGISVLKSTVQVAGIHFFTDNGGTMTNFEAKIYGLRIDV
tara:strand:+ start:128 stop:631 length:504 start_codon:yes stop_codon:yes gene_type:complete